MSSKPSAHRRKNVTSISAGRSGDAEQLDVQVVLKSIQKDLEQLHKQIDTLEKMVSEISGHSFSKGASL